MAPESDFPRRAVRVLLSIAFLAVATAGVLAVVAVRTGRAIILDTGLQHRIAYAWVIATVIAAVAAYALAGGAGERPRAGLVRALAVGALTDLAALAGVLAYSFVPVWPILGIAALVALLGLVLAWPRAEEPGVLSAAADGSLPPPPADGFRPDAVRAEAGTAEHEDVRPGL